VSALVPRFELGPAVSLDTIAVDIAPVVTELRDIGRLRKARASRRACVVRDFPDTIVGTALISDIALKQQNGGCPLRAERGLLENAGEQT